MKICVIQPRYSFDENDLDKRQKELFDLLGKCDASLDLIVLPEYSDALADDPDEARRYFEMGIDTVLTNDYLAIKNATEDLHAH